MISTNTFEVIVLSLQKPEFPLNIATENSSPSRGIIDNDLSLVKVTCLFYCSCPGIGQAARNEWITAFIRNSHKKTMYTHMTNRK